MMEEERSVEMLTMNYISVLQQKLDQIEKYAQKWETVGTTEVWGPDIAADIRAALEERK